jgi:hypothetical protein
MLRALYLGFEMLLGIDLKMEPDMLIMAKQLNMLHLHLHMDLAPCYILGILHASEVIVKMNRK